MQQKYRTTSLPLQRQQCRAQHIQSSNTSSPQTHPVPKHILPQDRLFTRLLTLASRSSATQAAEPAIIDLNTNVTATCTQLLSDVLHLRSIIRSRLSQSILADLDNGKEVYIHLLAPGGYEFTVGILAILALGAACSALSIAQPVNELIYYARKSKAVAVVTGTIASTAGASLADAISSSDYPAFIDIPVTSGLVQNRALIPPSAINIDSRGYQDPNGPGIVIFTSGTTEPPKAALLRRASTSDGALQFGDQLGLTSGDHLLHLVPVHHATGIWVSFFPFILNGATIEFKPGSFDPAWTWERWRQGGLTHFTGVPTIYMRMMRYYTEVIAKKDLEERHTYDRAAQQFKVMMCGTSALPKPINDFWTTIRRGRKIVQRYGSTELGVVFNMPFENNQDIPDGSVGEVSIGVDVKLSTEPGMEGEILAQSFNMFSKYLHDPEATKAAFDQEGYFHSGDIARREGKYYYIIGRASIDIIKSGGYKISALDVEREIMALPYIGECMVVGVQDEQFGQRVGCVVSLSSDETAECFLRERGRCNKPLWLNELRHDVRDRLAGYKLPTLLRVIEGELPKSVTGKIVKKALGPLYFPSNYSALEEVQVWTRQVAPSRPKL